MVDFSLTSHWWRCKCCRKDCDHRPAEGRKNSFFHTFGEKKVNVAFVCSETALQQPLVKAAVSRELQLGVF